MQKTASQRVLSELENLFRSLALESKKTDIHIKTSSEKAIIKLREYIHLKKTINELKYVLSNDIILRPLILSWSSKNLSLSLTALNILQKLLNINCISSDCFMQILISLRTLLTLHTNKYIDYNNNNNNNNNYNEYNFDIPIQIKLCQILIQIPNCSSWSVSRPFLQHIIYITLLLCQSHETKVKSTSGAALEQIVKAALEYSVNNHHEDQKQDNDRSDSPMYIFECLFHDLCCLASPQLLYLQKNQNIIPHQNNTKNDSDLLPNNTLVSFSSLNIDINNNNNNDNDDVIESKSGDNDIEIDKLGISTNNNHLITNLMDRLSTLRLLDIDFPIFNIPIIELLERLIANEEYFSLSIKYSSGLLHVLHNQLCPLLCEMIDKCDNIEISLSFETMQRIARLIIELISRHYLYLEIETDEILSSLLRLLEPSYNYPDWAPIIILEILRHLLKNSYLLKFFYIKYDMNNNSDKRVFGSLIHGLGRFINQTTTNKAKYTQKWSPKRLDNKYFSFIKDPKNPPINPSLQVSLAVLSLISFVEGLAVVCNVSSSPPTSPQSTTYPPQHDMNILDIDQQHDITLNVSMDIARHMVEVVWRPLLAALSHMLSHSIQESQYQQLLSIYQTTARICGRIQLIKPLERLLSSMSEHGLPHPFFNQTFSDILFKLTSNNQIFAANNINNQTIATSSSSSSSSGSGSSGSSSSASASSSSTSSSTSSSSASSSGTISNLECQDTLNDHPKPVGNIGNISFIQESDIICNESMIKLSIKNVCTIHALVNIAHGLGSILGSAWSVLLETFEKLDYIFHRGHIQLVDIDNNIISPDSHWNDEVNMLDSRLQQLFDSSMYLDDNSLCELLAALGHLSSSSLAGLATTLNKTHCSTRNKTNNADKNMLCSDDAISVDKVKSFALRKFVQTIEVNIYRLDKIWDHVIAHLHVIMNYKNSTLRHFGIKTLIRIQLKVLIDTNDDNNKMNKVNNKQNNDSFQEDLFSPYLKLFGSKYPDTRERVIRAVSQLLENAGEYISTGWPTIVSLLNYVPSTSSNNNYTVTISCLKLAFDDIRLIASDFLDCLPDFCILGLIKTVGLFGKQRKDNNISYSSIGLLWKISDYITLITNTDDCKQQKTELIGIADQLQIAIFEQLQVLCVDGRSDVRNCAMQTINSALVAYGDRFSLDSWINCINILRELLTDVVVTRTRLNEQQDAQKRSELSKREYRAFRKKWNETEKHCIRGGSRICKMFIAKLHDQHEFAIYWRYYLDTIIKLLDLNPCVASTGITCLQEIAQSTDFIYSASKNTKYWKEIINCYQSMIRNVANKEYQQIYNSTNNYLPFADVCDVMMESIRDLLNPEMPSRKLFELKQIEKLINNLDALISDKDLQHNIKHQPLEILDARLVRLKKLLMIYQQLPPLAPSIAKPIIVKIASYLMYVSKCCHSYHHFASSNTSSISPTERRNDGTPNTVKKLTRLSLSEKSLLRKTEKTMDFVSQRAITLLNQFYSIHIPYELKVECFEIVINGISTIMDPFLCPIKVVTNAIKGFQEVCKTGLPQFSAAQKNNNNDNDEIYKLSNVESLRVWSVLGDVVSIAFRLQHHTMNNNLNINNNNDSIYNLDNYNTEQHKLHNQQNINFRIQQLVELKLSILETTMEYILPFGDSAPQTLKKRIVLLLNGNCWSDNNSTIASIQRHARLGKACITAMFDLCSDTLLNKQKYDMELSAMSYQLLIPKIAFILDQYIDDEMSKPSNRPLPIYRQKHIVHILNKLKNLKINPKLDEIESYFDNKLKNNKNNNNNKISHQSQLYCSGPLLISGKTNNRPHLFRLYPVLCKLIRVKDDEIKNYLCDLFKTFGHEMGLN